ncbi:LOW QUALITY PROTEIN: hypothetical protein HJC23_008644 [Cyclotella cryptica]|uniref:Uncharacterized protein n=1 Tax=Cyclotella cryptica TaxID=29204 RepID=A0ABD3P6Z8_9STRA
MFFDEFFDAMKALMTVQEGRKGFAIYHSCFATLVAGTGFCINGGREIRQALGSCSIDQTIPTFSIIDSMRCTLKKEDTNPDCNGGSEHAEAIRYILSESPKNNNVRFDGSIRFRGTLVSGKLLEARGFREVSVLSSDMHSYESDYIGALTKYADCSTSKETAKNPESRERVLTIVIDLGRFDREDEIKSSGGKR